MGRVRLAAWARATGEELASSLRAADPRALLAALRAASDDDLRALGHDADRGCAVVEVVTSRLADLALPGTLAGLDAVVRWEATDPVAAATVRLHDGTATPAPGAAPDVTVRGTLVQLLRLVTGELDVAVAYLGGDLEIEGDSAAALAVAALFGDPRDIDPLDVSRALHGVDAEHLRAVMASGFRPVVLDEIFERMPAHVNGRKAAGVQITVGFRLTGRPDGEVDRYVLRLSDGRATVLAGEAADAVRDDRDATVTCEAHDFLRLVTGHLSAVTGVLRGQLRVRGDKTAALRLSSAFDIPKAAA
jgi:putative sterol carrier protein